MAPPKWIKPAILMMAWCVIGFASTSFIGHGFGIKVLYYWSSPGMAVNTALCFFLIGLCVVLICRES